MKLLALLALLAASVCQAQTSQSVPKPPWTKSASPAHDSTETDDTSIRVDVKLVNVFVTVTDEHGSPVGSLNKRISRFLRMASCRRFPFSERNQSYRFRSFSTSTPA